MPFVSVMLRFAAPPATLAMAGDTTVRVSRQVMDGGSQVAAAVLLPHGVQDAEAGVAA